MGNRGRRLPAVADSDSERNLPMSDDRDEKPEIDTEGLVAQTEALRERTEALVTRLRSQMAEFRVHELRRQLAMGRLTRTLERAEIAIQRSPLPQGSGTELTVTPDTRALEPSPTIH